MPYPAENVLPDAAPGLRRLARPFFLSYCVVVAYTTWLPFQFTVGRIQNLLERDSLFLQSRSPPILSDLLGNIVLFVPIGFLAFLMQSRDKRRRSECVARASVHGMLLSLVVELVQWFTPTRDPALSDVMSNTLGATLGAGLAAIVEPPLSASRSCKRLTALVNREPLVIVSMGLLVLASVWALVPFDASLHPQSLARSLRTMRSNPLGGAPPWVDLSSLLFFAVFSATGLRALKELWPTRKLRNSVMLLGFVGAWALGLEFLQLALKSRLTTLLDVVTALAGAGVGILVSLWLQREQDADTRRSVAAVAYGAGLLLMAIRPPGTGFGVEFVQGRLAMLIPGYAVHFDATLAGVTEFVHWIILFVPLGYFLAACTPRCRALPSPCASLLRSLACGLTAVAMNWVTTFATQGSAPAPTGALPACLGGLLGAGVLGWHTRFARARIAPCVTD